MDQQLKLTARGLAVYELMARHGLSLEAACVRLEHEIDALRARLEQLLSECSPNEVSTKLEFALKGVSLGMQSAYLEEVDSTGAGSPVREKRRDGASLH